MSTIGARLREERVRLGLSQTAFSEVGGVQKRAQINYEKDERLPDAGYLAALSSAGVDVLYVLTGQRSGLPIPGDSVRDLLPGKALEGVLPGKVLRESGVMIGQMVKGMKESGTWPGSALETAGLTRREKALLANYRGSDERGRKAIEGAASVLSHRDGDEAKHKGSE